VHHKRASVSQIKQRLKELQTQHASPVYSMTSPALRLRWRHFYGNPVEQPPVLVRLNMLEWVIERSVCSAD
jgi:hypothetical protein